MIDEGIVIDPLSFGTVMGTEVTVITSVLVIELV